MNRNMMIGGVVAIVVVIILVVVFVMGGDDEEENGDGGDGVTSESMTVAFEALLNGDTQAAQDLSCEEDHAGIEASAGGLTALTEAAGEDVEVGVSCNVEGDAGTCDLDVGGVVTTFEFAVVDGLVCGGLTPVE